MDKGKTVLLYSGGMDSWLIDKLVQPDVKLYVDVNSRYSSYEKARLPKDVLVEKLDLSRHEREDAIIPLRNLYFVMVATNYGNTIHLGATAGDRVLDKSYEFMHRTSELLTYLYQEQHWTPERKITVKLPFKHATKTELVKTYTDAGGDIEEAWFSSFSCYHPKDGYECFNCKPCYRKFVAFEQNGFTFSRHVLTRMFAYFRDNEKSLKRELKGRTPKEQQEVYTTAKRIGAWN